MYTIWFKHDFKFFEKIILICQGPSPPDTWYSCLYQTPISAARKSRKESQSPSCWHFGLIFHRVGAISLLCLLYLEIRGRNIQFYISQDSRALITLFLSLRASISSTLIISSLPSGWNNWKYKTSQYSTRILDRQLSQSAFWNSKEFYNVEISVLTLNLTLSVKLARTFLLDIRCTSQWQLLGLNSRKNIQLEHA